VDKRELPAGDLVEIRSFLLGVRDKSIRFLHEIRQLAVSPSAGV